MSAFEDVVEAWGFKIAGNKPAVLSPAGIAPDGSIVYSDAESFRDLIGAEPELGNPSVNGWILSSSSAGVRSWVAPNAHSHAIADVTGLQGALDGKMSTASYPDLVAIEALAGTSGLLRKTAANTWSLDTASYALSSAIPAASSTTPSALGTAAVGTGTTWARADHVHAMPTAAQVGAAVASHNHDAAYLGISATAAAATKLATGRTIGITGDATWTSPTFDGTANVTAALTLASVITAAGPIGSGTTVPVITYDAKGRITAVTTAAITPAGIGAAASVHGHSIADVTGLQTALDGRSLTSHNHNSLYLGISATAAAATKLATARTLTIGSTGKSFDGSANVSWSLAEIGAQPAGSYAAAVHAHAISDVTGLQSALDGKEPILGNPGTSGWLLSSTTAGIRSWVAPYALPTASASVLGGVKVGTGLAIASGVLSVSYGTAAGTACQGNDSRLSDARTPLSHVHAIADVTGLQTALDGRSLTSHNHTLDSLSNTTITSIATGELLRWNGTAWVNNTLAEAGIQPAGSYLTGNQAITLSGIVTGSGATSITTSIADAALSIAKTSGLQGALDGKMSTASYPDLVAIEALAGTSGLLRKTAANTWSLDTASYPTGAGSSGNVAWWNSSSNLTGNSGMTYDGATLTVGGTGGAAIYGKIGSTWLAGNLDPATFTMPTFAGNLIGWNRSAGGRRMDFYSSVGDAGHAHGFSWWSSVNGEIARLDQSGGLSLLQLSASTFPYLDGSKTIVSRTAAEMRTLLGVPSSTDAVVKNPSVEQKITSYALVVERSTASQAAFAAQIAGDAYGRVALQSDGAISWGTGAAARDTILYRAGADLLKTDDVFLAAGGFRSTGYQTGSIGSTGPGIEVHYDSTNSRARVLAYDRTAAARIPLALDGSPIHFYANGALKGSFDASGNFNLVNATASRVAVFDASKNLVSSSVTTTTELSYLSGVTSAIQTQLSGKASTIDANYGYSMEGTDPFASRESYGGNGGVRTWNGAGPFGSVWYNVVDVRHRNSWNISDVFGGELAWGMTDYADRLAFRSRNAAGTPGAWTEVWTKANLIDPTTGTGVSGRVAYWSGTGTQTSSANLTFDGAHLSVGGGVSADTIYARSTSPSGENIRVGNASWIGDIGITNTLNIRGTSSGNVGYIRFGSDYYGLGYNGSTLVYNNSPVLTAASNITFPSSSRLDISVSDATLPDAPVGTMVVAFNTSTTDRRIYASSGTLIISTDLLGNTYEQLNILVNRGGWLLVRSTSTRWVTVGAV